MRFGTDTLSYLRGESVSNGAMISLEPEADDATLKSRMDWLEELCAARNVIHVGCVDHNADQVRHKLQRGKWLHARLVAVAN